MGQEVIRCPFAKQGLPARSVEARFIFLQEGGIMKKIFAVIAILAISSTTFAEKKSSGQTWQGSSEPMTIMFGLSSNPAIAGPNSSHMLSALLGMSEKLAIQMHTGIFSTSPFTFSLGGTVKFNAVGTAEKGFHIGGGFGLGLASATVAAVPDSKFYFNFHGVVGLHFTVLDHIYFSFDGGPSVTVFNSTTSFSLAGFSPLLGTSILYKF